MFLNRFYYGIAYFLVLIREIIIGTADTSMRAIRGASGVDPVVIDIKTELTRPISQTILANSITLSPGSCTVELDSENQTLKVAVIAPRSAENLILFEPYIKKMLE